MTAWPKRVAILMLRLLGLALLLACPFAAVTGRAAPADGAGTALQAAEPSPTLALVRKRGTLVVGVKSDYPPFGFPDAQGKLQGFEVDMAAELARRLGVSLRLVGVTSANRLQRLEEGTVDVVIATLGDTAERRKVATAIEPNYYVSGVTLMVRPESRITDWSELRGQTVCAAQGSYFNRTMSQRYLLDLLTFNSARDAKLALRDGRCVGYMFDNTAIWSDLQQPEWEGYKAPLPLALPAPWSIAIPRREAGTEMERWLGDVVAEWHRTEFLTGLERNWRLPPTRFLVDTARLWNARGPDGEPVCRRDAHGRWPVECRNRSLLTSQDVTGLHNLGIELREITGWDLTFLYDAFDRERFLRGLAGTLFLMVSCVLCSLLVGAAGALLAESRLRLLGGLARAAAVWGRMTPPLLQMYLVFFGAAALLWSAYGLRLSPWLVAIGCLGYYTGASVMTALLDAAELRRADDVTFRLRWSSLPAVYGLAAGSITSSLVNVSKATMMASVIAVPELMAMSTSILVDNGNVKEVMNMLLLVFLVLIAITVRVLGRLEARLRLAAQRRT